MPQPLKGRPETFMISENLPWARAPYSVLQAIQSPTTCAWPRRGTPNHVGTDQQIDCLGRSMPAKWPGHLAGEDNKEQRNQGDMIPIKWILVEEERHNPKLMLFEQNLRHGPSTKSDAPDSQNLGSNLGPNSSGQG